MENIHNTPLVSACCITYNHEKYVKEAVESIFRQNYTNIEIIIVNDGSTDNTRSILDDLKSKSPFPIEVIHQENSGKIGHNLNISLSKAAGEYVIFCSLDDLLQENAVYNLVNEIKKDPALQLVITKKHITINNQSAVTSTMNYTKDLFNVDISEKDPAEILSLEKLGISFWLQAAIFRKTVIDAVGGFDEDMTGDDIVLRVKVLKYISEHNDLKLSFVDFPVFLYRIHGGNIHGNRERQCQILSEVLVRYFNKERSVTLDNWVMQTIVVYIIRRQFLKAFKLIFFKGFNFSRRKIIVLLVIRYTRRFYKYIKSFIVKKK